MFLSSGEKEKKYNDGSLFIRAYIHVQPMENEKDLLGDDRGQGL